MTRVLLRSAAVTIDGRAHSLLARRAFARRSD
jgi:hypothetical protein